MGELTAIVQRFYEAFGRGDVPGLLEHLSADIDWEFVAPPNLAYAGKRRNLNEVAKFFADVVQADQIHAFEPREFIEASGHVTVLGWERSTALDTGQDFTSEWIHLFSFKDKRVVRWRGFFNTAARYPQAH